MTVKRVKGDTSQRIKQMNIGEKITLPIDKWNAARSISSLMKKTFGARFIVNRQDEWTVSVTRLE